MMFCSFTYMLGDELLYTIQFPPGFAPPHLPAVGDMAAPFSADMPTLEPRQIIARSLTYAIEGDVVHMSLVLLTHKVL